MGEGHTPKTTSGVHESAEDGSRGIPKALIRAELNQVLQSQGFRSSKRSQDFLRYVVERTLEGQADTLKERTIGIDVFGRSSAYDPSDDATVRVKAGEVRKRLGLFYSSDGRQDEVRIELPHGAYVPEFHRVEVPAAPAENKHAETTVIAVSRRRWAIPLALVMLLAVGAIVAWLALRPASTVVDQFWAPVLRGSAPVILSTAYVPVYGVAPKVGQERPPKLEDFVLLTAQFV